MPAELRRRIRLRQAAVSSVTCHKEHCMKIVIAPDSYKECLSALQVATLIESGFREIFPGADYILSLIHI